MVLLERVTYMQALTVPYVVLDTPLSAHKKDGLIDNTTPRCTFRFIHTYFGGHLKENRSMTFRDFDNAACWTSKNALLYLTRNFASHEDLPPAAEQWSSIQSGQRGWTFLHSNCWKNYYSNKCSTPHCACFKHLCSPNFMTANEFSHPQTENRMQEETRLFSLNVTHSVFLYQETNDSLQNVQIHKSPNPRHLTKIREACIPASPNFAPKALKYDFNCYMCLKMRGLIAGSRSTNEKHWITKASPFRFSLGCLYGEQSKSCSPRSVLWVTTSVISELHSDKIGTRQGLLYLR